MANYVGAHCPVCSRRFVDDDDIVVCPICGAPHHRACYELEKRCALAELHIKGHTWEPPAPPQPAAESVRPEGACPVCGAENPVSGIFCQKCGAPLGRQQTAGVRAGAYASGGGAAMANAYTAAFGGVSPDEEIEGISARDIALYVGSNSHYFLPRFKQISQKGGMSPNFAAFFFNFLYYFYRKMYLAGAVMLTIFVLVQIPSFFIAPEYAQYMMANIEDILMGITPTPFVPTVNLWAYSAINYTRYVVMGSGLVLSMFSNRLYLGVVVANVRKVKQRIQNAEGGFDDALYTQELTRKGHTSRIAVVICLTSLMTVFTVVCNIIVSATNLGV